MTTKISMNHQFANDAAHTESMMEMLLQLLDEFVAMGLTKEAGPYIHELMAMVYESAGQTISTDRPHLRKPVRRSFARRANAIADS